ncbi:hypothetical protein VTL71DRAFT_13181 [Oculimacula yallundae]|uniref:Uncharacterized protein n=1 Tax=Oculimacula yallundae TaxID=86028 RepID=A0ABR4CJL5_9HELO
MVQLTTSLVATLVAFCPLVFASPAKLEARYPKCDRANVGFGHGPARGTDNMICFLRQKSSNANAVVSSGQVATTLGRIMDVCNRPDDLIQGNDYVIGNGDFWVEIRSS